MSDTPQAGKTAVFYHNPCLDGAASAWAAYQAFGDDAVYLGINHNTPEAILAQIMPLVEESSRVIFADIAPHPKVLEALVEKAGSIEIIDHHITEIRRLDGFTHPKVTTVLDNGKSGGSLVFHYLLPSEAVPPVIQWVETVDLERSDDPNFYPLAAYLDTLNLSTIERIVASFEHTASLSDEEILSIGHGKDFVQRVRIEEALQTRQEIQIPLEEGGPAVPVLMICGNPRELGRRYSKQLQAIAADHPSGAALSWFEDPYGTVRVSVRTNGVPDASRIAEYFGEQGLSGGGHARLAAAHFTKEQFEQFFGIPAIQPELAQQSPMLKGMRSSAPKEVTGSGVQFQFQAEQKGTALRA